MTVFQLPGAVAGVRGAPRDQSWGLSFLQLPAYPFSEGSRILKSWTHFFQSAERCMHQEGADANGQSALTPASHLFGDTGKSLSSPFRVCLLPWVAWASAWATVERAWTGQHAEQWCQPRADVITIVVCTISISAWKNTLRFNFLWFRLILSFNCLYFFKYFWLFLCFSTWT